MGRAVRSWSLPLRRFGAIAVVVAGLAVGVTVYAATSAVKPLGPASASNPAQRMSVVAVIGGRPFSPTSPWNTPIARNTQWFETALLHTHRDGPMHYWVGTGNAIVWYSKPTDPLWTFQMPNFIDAAMNRNRPAQTISVRAPANLRNGGDVDGVLVVVDGSRYYEVWHATVNPTTRTVTGQAWAMGDFVSGPGAGTVGNNDGVRASNFSWAAGLITGHDLASGEIDHALAIALPAPLLLASANSHRPPATAWDNGAGRGPIRMGSRIGIPAGVAKPSGLSSIGSMMFDALQRYGAFVGDYVGGDWPMFYTDQNTVTPQQVAPLYEFWNYGGSADMDKIAPLLRVADYQP